MVKQTTIFYRARQIQVKREGQSTELFPGAPTEVDCVSNVMAHAQKPDFVFRRNGRVHLNRRGRQFSRLLAAEVCASAVVMLDTPCSEVVGRVLATHSIRQFPLHSPTLYVNVCHHISTGLYYHCSLRHLNTEEDLTTLWSTVV